MTEHWLESHGVTDCESTTSKSFLSCTVPAKIANTWVLTYSLKMS